MVDYQFSFCDWKENEGIKVASLWWRSYADLNGKGLWLSTDWHVEMSGNKSDTQAILDLRLKVGIGKALAMISRVEESKIVQDLTGDKHFSGAIRWEPIQYIGIVVSSNSILGEIS